MITQKAFGVLILSGGYSRRMGYPKLFLPFDSKQNFCLRIYHEYKRAGAKQCIVVLNHNLNTGFWADKLAEVSSKCTIIWNKHPEKGRLYSISLGLKAMEKPQSVFIQDVDKPFIKHSDITQMLSAHRDNGYLQPVFRKKHAHPILINPDIFQHIAKSEDQGKTLKMILQDFKRNFLAIDNSKIDININTLSTYKMHFSHIQNL